MAGSLTTGLLGRFLRLFAVHEGDVRSRRFPHGGGICNRRLLETLTILDRPESPHTMTKLPENLLHQRLLSQMMNVDESTDVHIRVLSVFLRQ